MKIIIILLLFCGKLSAQTDTTIKYAGLKLKQSKDMQLLSIGFALAGTYLFFNNQETIGKVCYFGAGVSATASVVLHYKACKIMINGIKIEF